MAWQLKVSNPHATLKTFSLGKVHALQHPLCHPHKFSILLPRSPCPLRSPQYTHRPSIAPPAQTWSECRRLSPSLPSPHLPPSIGWESWCDPPHPPFFCAPPYHGTPLSKPQHFQNHFQSPQCNIITRGGGWASNTIVSIRTRTGLC